MGDKVTCKAVLKKAVDRDRPDYLFLVVDSAGPRLIPCRPMGEPRKAGGEPEWQYREEGGELHLQPSLLATDTGFHTDYNWTCAYDLCPEGVGSYDHFYQVNPDIKEPFQVP